MKCRSILLGGPLFGALALGAVLLAGRAPAQTPAPEAAQEAAVELMRTIAREMRTAEELLLAASAGEETGAAMAGAVQAIDKLLAEARGKESDALAALDKLIEQVLKLQREKRGGQSAERRPDRDRPERRPDEPGEGQDSDPRFQNPPEAKDQPERKRGPRDQTQADQPPPRSPEEQVPHADQNGVWGRLPDKLFKLITSREQTVFPAEFQAHVEEYFKRLAETKSP